MDYYLTLPRGDRALPEGVVVQISSGSSAYLCVVVHSCFCVAPRHGRLVEIFDILHSEAPWRDFSGFKAQPVDLCFSKPAVVLFGPEELLEYRQLLRGCPVAEGCTLHCGGRDVRVQCSGIGFIDEFSVKPMNFQALCAGSDGIKSSGSSGLENAQKSLENTETSLQDAQTLLRRCNELCLSARIAQIAAQLRQGNVLLTGPRGCGKSYSVELAARALGVPFFAVSDISVLNSSPSALPENTEYTEKPPIDFCGVLLLPSLDVQAPPRGDFATDVQNQNCAGLLRFLDGFQGRAVGTCEDSSAVDLALRRPGRLGSELVFCAISAGEREAFFGGFGAYATGLGAKMAVCGLNLSRAELSDVAIIIYNNIKLRENSGNFAKISQQEINAAVGAVGHQNVQMEAYEFPSAFASAALRAGLWGTADLLQIADEPTERALFYHIETQNDEFSRGSEFSSLSREAGAGALVSVETLEESEIAQEMPKYRELKPNIVDALQRAVENFSPYMQSRELCVKYGVLPQSVLIRGPADFDKNFMLNCLLLGLQKSFTLFALRARQVLSMYVGESEQNLRKTFRIARQHAPSIIVIEAIDDMFGDRNDQSGSSRLITALLAEIDGASTTSDVFVVATAESEVDMALTRYGRLGFIIDVGKARKPAQTPIQFDFTNETQVEG